MSELSERLRELAEAIQACEWELPIDSQETCLEAVDELEYLQKIKEGVDMSDIVTDLSELRTQMATIIDDETILDVFSRAASEIEKHRRDRKSFLAWRFDRERSVVLADSKFGDDSSPLAYVILWSDTEQRWSATFEGACVCLGALIDCMNACEDEERCHDDAV